MKRNKIILTVLILSLIVLIFSGCGGNINTPPNNNQSDSDRASIYGYIKSLEIDSSKNESIPIPNASVFLIDSDGKEYIVNTDNDGYYEFNGLSAGVNYIITATCPQKNDLIIYKDVAEKAIEGEKYNAGTADATSTALALILEELNENETRPEDVDIDKVINDEGFSQVKAEVEKVLNEEGNITESNTIEQSVASFSASSLNPITGDTTWGTEMIELSPDSYQPKLSDLIGYKKKDFRFITLDGVENSVELNGVVLAAEFDLDDGGGGITADLQIFKIIVASEGEGKRHWVGVEGNILGKAVRIELDFTPGFSAITTSAAYPDFNLIEDTPFVIKLINEEEDESKILVEGNSSKWIFLPEEDENQPPVISNLSADPPFVNVNQLTTITCIASDPDGDSLTYDWTVNAGSFEGDTSGPSVTWSAPSSTDIYIVVGCEVSDGKGGTDADSLNIEVYNENEKAKINVTFEPNPVPYSNETDSWPFNIILEESNGVGVTLSNLIFEEYNQDGQKIYTAIWDEEKIIDRFGTNYITAYSSIQFLEDHYYNQAPGYDFAEYVILKLEAMDDNGNLIEETDEMDLLPQ